jgi:hypothetical protein
MNTMENDHSQGQVALPRAAIHVTLSRIPYQVSGGQRKNAMEDGDTQIALAKLQYGHELKKLELEQQHELKTLELQNQVANFGLQGTLWGTWAALAAIALIALVQIFFDRYVVQGFAFATMVGTIAIPVALYGAFIYNRTLSLAGNLKRGEVSTNVWTSWTPPAST